MIYNDIKSANILYNYRIEAIFIDFELAIDEKKGVSFGNIL